MNWKRSAGTVGPLSHRPDVSRTWFWFPSSLILSIKSRVSSWNMKLTVGTLCLCYIVVSVCGNVMIQTRITTLSFLCQLYCRYYHCFCPQPDLQLIVWLWLQMVKTVNVKIPFNLPNLWNKTETTVYCSCMKFPICCSELLGVAVSVLFNTETNYAVFVTMVDSIHCPMCEAYLMNTAFISLALHLSIWLVGIMLTVYFITYIFIPVGHLLKSV
jgi:hypothetical protein